MEEDAEYLQWLIDHDLLPAQIAPATPNIASAIGPMPHDAPTIFFYVPGISGFCAPPLAPPWYIPGSPFN
jgi:hypothetical protein